jgi:hypothetical protein
MCLNLLQRDALILLQNAYDSFKLLHSDSKLKDFPKNKPIKGNDKLLRRLDCAVIETIHLLNSRSNEQQYDSVRGVFFEGEDLYPDAGFKEKNHIQICVRNRNCIKGYFLPRSKRMDTYPDSLLKIG